MIWKNSLALEIQTLRNVQTTFHTKWLIALITAGSPKFSTLFQTCGPKVNSRASGDVCRGGPCTKKEQRFVLCKKLQTSSINLHWTKKFGERQHFLNEDNAIPRRSYAFMQGKWTSLCMKLLRKNVFYSRSSNHCRWFSVTVSRQRFKKYKKNPCKQNTGITRCGKKLNFNMEKISVINFSKRWQDLNITINYKKLNQKKTWNFWVFISH